MLWSAGRRGWCGQGFGCQPGTNPIPETPPHAWGEIWGPWECKLPTGQDLASCLLWHLGGRAAGLLQQGSKETARLTLNLGRAQAPLGSFFFLSTSLSFFLSLSIPRMPSCALLSCLKPHHLLWVAYCPAFIYCTPKPSPDVHQTRPTPRPSGKLWQVPDAPRDLSSETKGRKVGSLWP